jgi:hypothetical protein
MMKDMMLDVETFSTDSNGVIVSVSAVMFDLDTGATGDTFEMGVDINEQVKNGAVIDGGTVNWWLAQPDDAQAQLLILHPTPVNKVLKKFNAFCVKNDINSMWGNGATFDNVLLRNLYKRHDITFKVPYWADRDVRTLVAIKRINTKDFEFEGTRHNGIDDCKHQIKYCCS